jgi:hypothetical protein
MNDKGLKMKQPDPTNHRIVSFAKSSLRILAGGFLCVNMLISAGVLLIVAELLGILEELV